VPERDGGSTAPAIDTDIVPKKPTYKQDWPADKQAQITEKRRFQVLLHDLCRGVQEPPSKGGRPRTPLADVVFACAFKVCFVQMALDDAALAPVIATERGVI